MPAYQYQHILESKMCLMYVIASVSTSAHELFLYGCSNNTCTNTKCPSQRKIRQNIPLPRCQTARRWSVLPPARHLQRASCITMEFLTPSEVNTIRLRHNSECTCAPTDTITSTDTDEEDAPLHTRRELRPLDAPLSYPE